MKSKRDVRNWKKNRAGSISVYFRLTTTSTFSVFYSVWDKFIWVSSCINLKIPSVGLLISNSVVLDMFVDLFKHTMNCQCSLQAPQGPAQTCSSTTDELRFTKQPQTPAPILVPGQHSHRYGYAVNLPSFPFARGKTGIFLWSLFPSPANCSATYMAVLAQTKGQHLKAAVRCPGPTLTGTVTRGNVYKN